MSTLSFLGNHVLSLALPCALLSLLAYGVGLRRNIGALALMAQRATVSVFVLLSLAVIFLISAFITQDYSILYVAAYSSRSLPLFFKVTGLWAGLDGSILFWVWLVSLYSVLVLKQNRLKHPDWMPWINAVFMIVILFFLAMILFANNPFSENPMQVTDGKGLNPLLQNLAMVFHPPSLYLGYTGFTVPFAFAIAALVTRRLDASWIEASRRWTMVAWFFLTLGNVLGAGWAYVELGWGGFWAWDPVENAAIMPWFVASAYIHSVQMQQKRGMLMVWNAVLICLTFTLTIFGTYLTRSGIVESVHAFSGSKLGPYFLGFLIATILISAGLIISRRRELQSQNTLESFFSRESAFLLNNIILVVASLSVMWGTLFPTLSEAVTGERITVGPPFFNKIMAPIGLILLALMGFGPMVSWKKATLRNFRSNLLSPLIPTVLTVIGLLVVGVRHWYVVTSTSLIVYVLWTIAVEFIRGTRAVRLQKKIGFIDALMDLVIHNNRRYGGYLVHIGIVMVFLAIAGTVYKQEYDFTLMPGESYEAQGYQFQYTKPVILEDEHKTSLTAEVDVIKSRKIVAQLKPAKFFYQATQQPTTEVSIYHTFYQDVYIIVANLAPINGKAEFRVTFNPLISFLWLGGFVILLGTIVVLLPRGLKFRGKAIFVFFLVLLCGSLAQPQVVQSSEEADEASHVGHDHSDKSDPFANIPADDPLLQRLKNVGEKMDCMCGDCIRTTLRTCTCSYAKGERDKILAMLKNGDTEDQIMQAFVREYGLRALSTPPARGFFLSGTWVPWIFVVLAILFAWALISLWKRRMPPALISVPASTRAGEYQSRLEEELKSYDD